MVCVLNWRIGGQAVNPASRLGEIERPSFFGGLTISRVRAVTKDATPIDFTNVVVSYPTTGRNHAVDHDASQIRKINGEKSASSCS